MKVSSIANSGPSIPSQHSLDGAKAPQPSSSGAGSNDGPLPPGGLAVPRHEPRYGRRLELGMRHCGSVPAFHETSDGGAVAKCRSISCDQGSVVEVNSLVQSLSSTPSDGPCVACVSSSSLQSRFATPVADLGGAGSSASLIRMPAGLFIQHPVAGSGRPDCSTHRHGGGVAAGRSSSRSPLGVGARMRT